jgi:hypothetical protein
MLPNCAFLSCFKFSVNVETGLLSKFLNPSQRNEFVRDICTLISTNTRYPTENERTAIARQIIDMYPFLKDHKMTDSSCEWVSTVHSIPSINLQITNVRYLTYF